MSKAKTILDIKGNPNAIGKDFLAKISKGFSHVVPQLLTKGIKPYQIMMWLEGRFSYIGDETKAGRNMAISSLEDMQEKINQCPDGKKVLDNDTEYMGLVFDLHDHCVVPLVKECIEQDYNISQLCNIGSPLLKKAVYSTICQSAEKRKSRPMELWTEDSESLKDRKAIGCPLEDCIFCAVKTSTWHMNTNNPICLDCATFFKVTDIPEDYGQNIRRQKRSGTFDLGDSVRAN